MLSLLIPVGAARAADAFLITDYPALSARAGASATLDVSLKNDGGQPVRLQLSVDGLPEGWHAQWLGGGRPVAAAMAGGKASVPLQLKLQIPESAEARTYHLELVGRDGDQRTTLPVDLALTDELPASLKVETKLPALRGAPDSSFDYQFTVHNDSGKDVLAQLSAQAPEYFETSFTESYGSQQLTSVPIKAGESKDLKLSVHPPAQAKAGDYPVKIAVKADDASAAADVALQVTGQPSLRISGRDGLMSASAQAGKAETMTVVVANDGSAAAQNVALTASAPSGWKIDFEPKTIEQLAPGQQQEVQATVTPSERSLAGDYMVTLRAAGEGRSASGDFRVTVGTSSLWGVFGIAIIAIAILILVGAVARFGRR